MKTIAILATALPLAALAQAPAPAPDAQRGHTASTHERYCEKLREGPEAYARFVHRLRVVYGYTYTDFARREPGAPVVAECAARADRLAKAAAEKTLR